MRMQLSRKSPSRAMLTMTAATKTKTACNSLRARLPRDCDITYLASRSMAHVNMLNRILTQRNQTSCIASIRHHNSQSNTGPQFAGTQRSPSLVTTGHFPKWHFDKSHRTSALNHPSTFLPTDIRCLHHSPWKHPPTSSVGSSRHSVLTDGGKWSNRSSVPVRLTSSYSPTKVIMDASPESIQRYLKLIRFDRPIGTWLLYWPCTWSIALAAQPGGMPDLKLLALFGAGAFFMRGAGCIINDMWDKDYDAKVERTKLRPLASGELTQFQALVFLGTQLSCALAILLQLNNYSICLGACSMGLVVLYPLAKRYTYWPQLVLGLTLNWGVLLGWSQLQGGVEVPTLALYSACVLYTMIYDTIYSHQDKYDDMLIGVKSTALRLGDNSKPWLAAFAVGMAGGLATTGFMCDMTWPYYLATVLTTGRLGQQIYSTDLNNAEDCAKAFRGNFYLGAIMFAGIVLGNALK